MTHKFCVLLPAVLCAVLCGCDEAPSEVQSKTPPAQVYPQAVVSFNTPFPNQYLEGTDKQLGTYYSFGVKVTYSIEADGALKMQHRDEERMIDEDPPSDEAAVVCGPRGGPGNQTTMWFPYTAILLSSGTLDHVTADAAVLPLRRLTEEDGKTQYKGEDDPDRSEEYWFVPCVGEKHAHEGWRLDGYIPASATIAFSSPKGRIPVHGLGEVRPYMRLYFWTSEEGIPVPMRIVLITIDPERSRVVAQYQSTVGIAPPIRKVDIRSASSTELADTKPSAEARKLRAIFSVIDSCAPPTQHPFEPCAAADQITHWRSVRDRFDLH